MAITSRVVSRKYWNAFKNEPSFSLNLSDFAPNLTANIGEFCKAEFILEIGWDSIATTSSPWMISPRAGLQHEISRASGSFVADGWAVGNTFDFVKNYSTSATVHTTGTVDFIADDGSYMFVTTAGALTHGSATDDAIRARADSAANYLSSLIYSPNLIENDDSFSIASLQNGASVAWYTTNARSLTPVALSPLGVNESFVSGDVFVNYEGAVATYFQSYRISHTFIVYPFFFEGTDLSLLTPPSFLAGPASLKYVFQADFRTSFSDPSTTKRARFENNRGAVGYLNETIGGGAPAYRLKSIAFNNADNTLLLQTQTVVTFTIEGAFSVPNTKYGVHFSYLPSEAEYRGNSDFYDTFHYDFKQNFIGTSSSYPGSIISAMSASLSGPDLVIQATFEFTPALQAIFDGAKQFFLGVQVGDTSLSSSVSDRVMLFAAQKEFGSDVRNNDLILMDSIEFTDYNSETESSPRAWNEDGLSCHFDFRIDRSKQAVLKSLSANLVAYKPSTGNYFLLDGYNFDLSTLVVSGGIQQANIQTNRGYLISPNSIFNEVSLQNGTLSGDFVPYSGRIAQKINWLSWKPNPNADTVFFDSEQPRNGLNFLSSNYSNAEGYEIRMQFTATVEGEDPYGAITLQDYAFYSSEIDVNDYLKDGNDPPKCTPLIETFDSAGTTNLGGNMDVSGFTLFRITWTFLSPVATTVGASAVHRIERFEQEGSAIFELSTFDPEIRHPNSPLVPISGESFVTMNIIGGNLVTECLIDGSRLSPGARYSLSGKVTKI